MGKLKKMEQEIREADLSKRKGGAAVMIEAAQFLLGMRDCLEGIVSEQGFEALEPFTRCGTMLLARSGQIALALKAMADKAERDDGATGYYELMIRNLYQSEEAPTTTAHRTIEGARAAMEEDIRETLAAKDPHFDEEDVKREDADNVQLGDEIRYEIEWKDLYS